MYSYFTGDNDLFNRSSGGMLCQTLVKAYDVVCRRSLEQHYVIKMAVMNALKMLLHISSTAKAAALEGWQIVCYTFFFYTIICGQ